MEINTLLEQIDSLKKEADSLRPFKPESERRFWEKFRLEFNYNSNHMEGNTLTYGQTKLLLIFDRLSGDIKGRDVEEMKAHNVALKMITELSSDPETILTEKLIREINEIILVRPFYNDAITPDGQPTKRLITPGAYKKHPNSVLLPDGNMFYYASPEETPALMGDFVEWYKHNKDEIHPVRLAALMHYKLVRIHPFDDSNGRTTRLLMNFILMQNGYAPAVIESKKKDAYLAALNKADVGDIGAFEEYIAGISLRWQEIFLKAIRGEKIEEPEDFEKEVEILKKRQDENHRITKSFSVETVIELFKKSFYPLLQKLTKKLSPLDQLYFSNQIQFGFDSSVYVIHHTEKILKIFEEQSNRIKLNGSIQFQYVFKGLKTKNRGVTDDIIFLKIQFNEFSYSIYLAHHGKPFLEKVYSSELSNSDVDGIIDTISKEALENIKDQI
jgi:Fic family protein